MSNKTIYSSQQFQRHAFYTHIQHVKAQLNSANDKISESEHKRNLMATKAYQNWKIECHPKNIEKKKKINC